MTEIKRILLTGGTGFIGSALTQALLETGYQVTVLTRQTLSDRNELRYINELPPTTEAWPFDAIINLAGENLFAKRWSKTQKQRLRDSRLQLTEKLLAGIKVSPDLQRFISASAIGYYGASNAAALTESAAAGDDFAAQLCRDWEACALQASEYTSLQRVRIGVVLGNGGALNNLLPPFKLGLGGPIGSGKQGFSWIHISDLVALFAACLRGDITAEVINAVAPNPVSNKTFSKALGRALHRPAMIPMPALALRLMLGEVSALLTTGQYVVPQAALTEGFHFQFDTIDSALDDLVH